MYRERWAGLGVSTDSLIPEMLHKTLNRPETQCSQTGVSYKQDLRYYISKRGLTTSVSFELTVQFPEYVRASFTFCQGSENFWQSSNANGMGTTELCF